MTEPTARARPQYVDHLLILRGLCALGVLAVHLLGKAPAVLGIPELISRYARPLQLVLGNGECFVLTFFILSGYLMGKLFHTGRYSLSWCGIKRFYRNRLLRIAPLLYVNLIACMLFLPGREGLLPAQWISVLGDFTFLNNLTHKLINPVTWSLSYEMQDYMICPLFAMFFATTSRRALRYAVLVLIALTGYSFISQHFLTTWSLTARVLGLARYTWLFFGGYMLTLIVPRLIRAYPGRSGNWWIWGYAAFLAGVIGNGMLRGEGHLYLAQMQMLLFTMLAIMALEYDGRVVPQGISPRIIAGRGMTWLGILSYGIYLWHLPCIEMLQDIPDGIMIFAQQLVAIGIPAALTVYCWYLLTAISATLLITLLTFFGVERVFRPGLYDFRDSRMLAKYLTHSS